MFKVSLVYSLNLPLEEVKNYSKDFMFYFWKIGIITKILEDWHKN